MADLVRGFSNGSFAANWRSRLNYIVASQDVGGNRTYIELRQYIYSTSGAYSQNGLWDGRTYINGGQASRNTPTTTISNGEYLMNASGHWVGHDANGNLYITVGSYCNAPTNEMTYGETGWTLPRLALAPSINSNTVDQIKPTSARFGTEINSLGHGTSAATRMYYRIQGSGSDWSQTSDQGDVAGFNYWTVTGLKPATTYEYFSRWWNNNGDTADSSTQTFKTQSVPGMMPVLMGIIG